MIGQNGYQQQNSSTTIKDMWLQKRLPLNLTLDDTYRKKTLWYKWIFQR